MLTGFARSKRRYGEGVGEGVVIVVQGRRCSACECECCCSRLCAFFALSICRVAISRREIVHAARASLTQTASVRHVCQQGHCSRRCRHQSHRWLLYHASSWWGALGGAPGTMCGEAERLVDGGPYTVQQWPVTPSCHRTDTTCCASSASPSSHENVLLLLMS